MHLKSQKTFTGAFLFCADKITTKNTQSYLRLSVLFCRSEAITLFM